MANDTIDCTQETSEKEKKKEEPNSLMSKSFPFVIEKHFSQGGSKNIPCFHSYRRTAIFPGVTVIAILLFPDPQISPAGKAGSLIMS